MNLMMLALMVQGSPRNRGSLLKFFMRQRARSMKKWKHFLVTLVAAYYTWKGGSLKVKNASGVEVDITDVSLSDSERLMALAQQQKLNSEDQRWFNLLIKGIDLAFLLLDDDSEIELMMADLGRTLDFNDAPSLEQLQSMQAAYDARMGSTSGSSGGGSSYGSNGLLNAPAVNRNTQMGTATNPIPVDGRRGGL